LEIPVKGTYPINMTNIFTNMPDRRKNDGP
jgi:hypothetical protein